MELTSRTDAENPVSRAQLALRRALLAWESPAWSGAISLAIYAALTFSYGKPWDVSDTPYFSFLADGFLHGDLALRLNPPHDLDLVRFGGRYFLYWPPLPAILLMPFVAAFGVGFSDVLFTVALGAVNVALVAMLLRTLTSRELADLGPDIRALLVLFFALGTVHVTLAPLGRVWFTSQVVGLTCVALAYLATLRLRGWPAFLLTGLALAGAAATRNNMILAGIWPAWYLIRQNWDSRWVRLAGRCLIGLAPVVMAIVGLGLYNAARFGGLLDNGYAYHQMSDQFAADYARYGAFNPHFVPVNLYYQLVAYPFFNEDIFMGGSVFLLSPIWMAAFWGVWRRDSAGNAAALALTVIAVDVPILLLMGTGWVQFGSRYTLDFAIPLLFLTAMGIRRWPTWVVGLATAISIAHFTVGYFILSKAVG